MGQVRNLMKTCTVEKNILMKTCDSRGKISSISTKLFEFPRWSIITERTNRSQSPPAGPAHPYFCAGGASSTNCDASSTNPYQITYQIIWSFCTHKTERDFWYFIKNRTWFLVIQLRQTHMLGKAWCNPPFKTHKNRQRRGVYIKEYPWYACIKSPKARCNCVDKNHRER